MNSIRIRPRTNEEKSGMSSGLNHDHDGSMACGPAVPAATLYSAVPAKITSTMISMTRKNCCSLADSSTPT